MCSKSLSDSLLINYKQFDYVCKSADLSKSIIRIYLQSYCFTDFYKNNFIKESLLYVCKSADLSKYKILLCGMKILFHSSLLLILILNAMNTSAKVHFFENI